MFPFVAAQTSELAPITHTVDPLCQLGSVAREETLLFRSSSGERGQLFCRLSREIPPPPL